MKTTNTVIKVFSHALGFSAIIALAFFTILGMPITTSNARAVGHFLVSENPYGIGVYQTGKHRSYMISPYNDYMRDAHGVTTPLLSVTTLLIEKPVPLVTEVIDRINRIMTSFDALPVSKTFKTESNVRYSADINGSRVTVTRTIERNPRLAFTKTTATTITYSRDDLVFDQDGKLYTENTDEETNILASLYNINLSRSDTKDRRVLVTSSVVTIVNPHIPGALRLFGRSGQRIFVDKDAKRIDIEEDIDEPMLDRSLMSLDIDVFASIREAHL